MSQYSFPILTDREVAQCLHELGMNVSVEQLGKPTFEFVHPIYENLVTALVGITRYENWYQKTHSTCSFYFQDLLFCSCL